ncbi:MAG TPA: peptidoglycan DD-metalloendopeptidase family protein [Acidimicrobiales bacterium]|nr:peptidoglycan DD-metalloendopeptidase family protein [Acidimicrobiales bacterium]
MRSFRRGPRRPVPCRPGLPALRRAVGALLAGCLVASAAPAAAQTPERVVYRPPVDGPVVDSYRPPVSPYAPGNRGLDYATVPGQPVGAAAEGEVVFAGPIGPSGHVVVLHADGIRTSYSFLDSVGVVRGQRVVGGQAVGTAGAVLHFGARAGEEYIDPGLLLASGPAQVHLVPVPLRSPQDEARERRWLVELVADVIGVAWQGARPGVDAGAAAGDALDDALAWAGEAAVVVAAEAASLAELAAIEGWEYVKGEVETLWDQAVLLAHYAGQLPISPLFVAHVVHQWERAERFRASQQGCTPALEPPPPPPPGRRIAVVVGGFGSSSAGADVFDVELASLGYGPDEVAHFSYAGGRVPDVGALDGVPTSHYGPDDANGDLAVAGRRLAGLLDAIGATHPGVPVDVIAHSQGGVVARLALVDRGPVGEPVANLVTLGSPHNGADVATANALLGTTTVGELAQAGATQVSGASIDGASTAAGQLSETSQLMDDLEDEPLPEGTRVTSIAARGDLTVAGLQSSLGGATNVMVDLEGVSAHAELPGSVLTQREMALALAGQGPTCRDLTGDLALAAAISLGEDALGLATGLGAIWLDHQIPGVKVPTRTPGPVGPTGRPGLPSPDHVSSSNR